MEAVSAFDGGVVEAGNLRGLRSTRGNSAQSTRRSRIAVHRKKILDPASEGGSRRTWWWEGLKCVRGAEEEGVGSTDCLASGTQMSELS